MDFQPFTDGWWRGVMERLPQQAMQTDGRAVEALLDKGMFDMAPTNPQGPGVQFDASQQQSFGDLIDPAAQQKLPGAGRLSLEQMKALQSGMYRPPAPPAAGAASPASGHTLGQALRINTGVTPRQGQVYEPHSLSRILNGGV